MVYLLVFFHKTYADTIKTMSNTTLPRHPWMNPDARLVTNSQVW